METQLLPRKGAQQTPISSPRVLRAFAAKRSPILATAELFFLLLFNTTGYITGAALRWA